ncbi:MAG: hypothetical protein V8S33_05410 [Intestinibacter bartlettii]
MKMSKFSIKKKSKEIPTEAVIAYSKGNMLEKIGKKESSYTILHSCRKSKSCKSTV